MVKHSLTNAETLSPYGVDFNLTIYYTLYRLLFLLTSFERLTRN